LKINLLLAGTFVILLVTGMTGSAFAGGPNPITQCTLTQNQMVNLQMAPNEQVIIPKTIECDGLIGSHAVSQNTCQFNLSAIIPGNIIFNGNIVTFEETITNNGNTAEEHCTQTYTIGGQGGGSIPVIQELWFNERIIGGEIISIESSSLLLAGAQSFSWMIPVTLSVLGIGLFVVSRKSENS